MNTSGIDRTTWEAAGFRPCIVIPYFRHEGAIGGLLARLRPHGVPCWIVDDGSGGASAAAVRGLAETQPDWLHLLVLPENRGKGAAVHAGFTAAAAAGRTHALQIDADGQHDAADVPRLLAVAATTPDAVIAGVPIYDQTIPAVRYYGRRLTHWLVWLQTGSRDLRDTMCGFRVYPLASTLRVWARTPVGARMDFDTEILVRLYWAGLQVFNVPTRVTYPADGVSHYRYMRDNLRMIWLHCRLLGGMVRRRAGRAQATEKECRR
ncbi:MAG TPA: glycosyltransferase family 2 protein [Nevskiaceae bacterium]